MRSGDTKQLRLKVHNRQSRADSTANTGPLLIPLRHGVQHDFDTRDTVGGVTGHGYDIADIRELASLSTDERANKG